MTWKNNKNIYFPMMMASEMLLKQILYFNATVTFQFLFSNLVNIILFKNHKSHVYIQQYLAFHTTSYIYYSTHCIVAISIVKMCVSTV